MASPRIRLFFQGKDATKLLGLPPPQIEKKQKKRKASGKLSSHWKDRFISRLWFLISRVTELSVVLVQVNGEVGVKNSFKSDDLPGHKRFANVDQALDYIGENTLEMNGRKTRGRSDKRKPPASVKRNCSANVNGNGNGKSASSGSEVSSDVGCQSPDSGTKDGDQTPSEAGSVDGTVPVLKRSSSHGELRSDEPKTEHFRKQSTLDSGSFVRRSPLS